MPGIFLVGWKPLPGCEVSGAFRFRATRLLFSVGGVAVEVMLDDLLRQADVLFPKRRADVLMIVDRLPLIFRIGENALADMPKELLQHLVKALKRAVAGRLGENLMEFDVLLDNGQAALGALPRLLDILFEPQEIALLTRFSDHANERAFQYGARIRHLPERDALGIQPEPQMVGYRLHGQCLDPRTVALANLDDAHVLHD